MEANNNANLDNKVLQQQVEDGFVRRSTKAVKKVFNKFKNTDTQLIQIEDLPKALQDAHSRTKTLSAIARLTLVCASQQQQQGEGREGGLNEETFTRLVQGADEVQTWLERLPLSQIVADSFPLFAGSPTTSNNNNDNNNDDEDDVLHQIAQMDNTQLGEVAKAAAHGLQRVLQEARDSLSQCFEAQQQLKQKQDQDQQQQQQSGQHTKFSVEPMASGSLADFHAGLAGRIGIPDMDFENTMRMEHCSKYGSDVSFTTSNYNITTTPHHEWDVVVNAHTTANMNHGRCVPSIDSLLGSEEAKRAGLTRPEVIALVLYTGPMFMRYNTMLRRFPQQDFDKFSSNGSLFTTTIFVLVSAVQKLARVSAIAEGTLLYRGLGGFRDLPERFVSGEVWTGINNGDGNGATAPVRGMTEWGFMSTTSNKSVALQYSGAVQGRPKASVMVMEPNGVDRGASIQSFSQYPGEAEFLWVPCSFVQPRGQAELCVEPEGLVTLVHVRVSANLKGDTVEELVQRKKLTHLTAFATAIDDLKTELWTIANTDNKAEKRLLQDKRYTTYTKEFTVSSLIGSIVHACEQTRQRHKRTDVSKFVDNTSFRGFVEEMLDVVLWGKHNLLLWLEDTASFIVVAQQKSLRQSHRDWMQLVRRRVAAATESGNGQERQQAALEFLRSKGLVSGSLNHKNSDGEQVILSAAKDAWSREDMEMVVAAGGNVNCFDNKTGVSAIYGAAEFGHVDCLDVMIKAGANVNKCKNGSTPVWIASCNGHALCVDRLVAAGADVNKFAGDDGSSPVYIASQNGHTLCIDRLVAAGADVNKCGDDDGTSAVWIASQNGHASCIDRLVAAGADVNKCIKTGASPLFIASQTGHALCIDRLVAAGADVNKCTDDDGTSPVWIASQEGHASCIDRLVAAGADVNNCNRNGISAVYIASRNGHALCIDRLVAAGANVNKYTDGDSSSPVYIASQQGHALCVDRLVAAGADVNKCRDDHGASPVYIASHKGHVSCIDRLVAAGADVNKCDKNGSTPVYIASQKGHDSCIDRLVAAGADVNKCDKKGSTPVYIASYKGHDSCIDRLVAAGADVNKCRDDHGASPVWIASQKGHDSCIDRLVAAGADINKCANDGSSPLAVAQQQGHTDCVKRLQALGATA